MTTIINYITVKVLLSVWIVPGLTGLGDSHFTNLVEFMATTFDLSSMMTLMNWILTDTERGLSALSKCSRGHVEWLKFALSKKTDRIESIACDPVMKSILEIYKGISTDISHIKLDNQSPNFNVYVEMLVSFMEMQSTVQPDTILHLAESSLTAEHTTRLSQIVMRHGVLMSLSAKIQPPLPFTQIETWCDVIAELSPMGAVNFLEKFVSADDQFWALASEWLATRPSCMQLISDCIVARINSLKHISSAFIVRYFPLES